MERRPGIVASKSIALASTLAARMRATVDRRRRRRHCPRTRRCRPSRRQRMNAGKAVDADGEGQRNSRVAAYLALVRGVTVVSPPKGSAPVCGTAGRGFQPRGHRRVHRAHLARLALDRIRQDHASITFRLRHGFERHGAGRANAPRCAQQDRCRRRRMSRPAP